MKAWSMSTNDLKLATMSRVDFCILQDIFTQFLGNIS